jgi:YfiH family protein
VDWPDAIALGDDGGCPVRFGEASMRRRDSQGLTYFEFSSFPAGQRHAVLTRLGGVSRSPFDTLNLSASVPDDRASLRANRKRAYGAFGFQTDSLVHAHLVHGAAVARVTPAQNGLLAGHVDGLITDQPGCGLTMNYADCAPILLYDPDHPAIGLGHAGWQGAVRGLPGALVRAMQAAFGSDPARLIAGIGPCIGPCCYEVGEPVVSQVQRAFPKAPGLLLGRPNGARPHFDLPGANRISLKAAGVKNIEEAGLCTACRTDLFFSHRAEQGQTGRFGVLLALPAE